MPWFQIYFIFLWNGAFMENIYYKYFWIFVVVWPSSFTQTNIEDIEGIQNSFIKLVLGPNNTTSGRTLIQLHLLSLYKSRKLLNLTRANRPIENTIRKYWFQLFSKSNYMKTRKWISMKLLLLLKRSANTERLTNSSVMIFMQTKLNKENVLNKEKNKW